MWPFSVVIGAEITFIVVNDPDHRINFTFCLDQYLRLPQRSKLDDRVASHIFPRLL